MNNQYSGTAVGDVKLFYNENAGTQSPSPAVPALPGFTGLTGRRPGSTRVRSPAAARVGLALPRGSHAWYTLPCLALPSLALPHLALPCLTLPCLALPCLALPHLRHGAQRQPILRHRAMWKAADHSRQSLRPSSFGTPRSARSSAGRPPASAILAQLADMFWLAGHTGWPASPALFSRTGIEGDIMGSVWACVGLLTLLMVCFATCGACTLSFIRHGTR